MNSATIKFMPGWKLEKKGYAQSLSIFTKE